LEGIYKSGQTSRGVSEVSPKLKLAFQSKFAPYITVEFTKKYEIGRGIMKAKR
jgi:hypothetical protein